MYHYIVINNKLLATENGLVAVRPMAYTVNGFRPDENGNVNVDVSEQLYEFIGKENRLGFNGVLQGKKITFTLDESISNFELKNSTGYLFNLHLPLVETIDQDYTFEILDKNNNVINLHCIYSQKENETSTVGDFKQLQEYSTSTGYSWDFYGYYYENTNSSGETKRVIYSDSVVRESVDTEKGEIFYNKLLANKYTVGQVVICSENYSMNGTKLEKGHIYKVIQENIVDGEIVLVYTDITPETGYSKAEIDTFLSSKVDAVEGKGLSTNDYTNEDKALVETIQDVQEVEEVDVDTTPTKNSGNLITSGGVYEAIKTKIDTSASPITLADNTSFRLGEITTLTINNASSYPLDFMCEVVFTSGTGFSMDYSALAITFSGDDCDAGVFTPSDAKTYNILFFNNSNTDTASLQAIVRGV